MYLRADTKWGKQDYIGGYTQSNASGIKWMTQGFEGLWGGVFSKEGVLHTFWRGGMNETSIMKIYRNEKANRRAGMN